MGDHVDIAVARARRRNGLARPHPGQNGDALPGPAAQRRLISHPDAAISKSLRETTAMVLATLTPREQQVLRLRFGIGEPIARTADEIGRWFAIPAMQVRQIEMEGLRKLRRPGGAHSSRTIHL